MPSFSLSTTEKKYEVTLKSDEDSNGCGSQGRVLEAERTGVTHLKRQDLPRSHLRNRFMGLGLGCSQSVVWNKLEFNNGFSI